MAISLVHFFLLQTIPKKISSEDQKEVLRLLCKVHELEIYNTEVQSSCILRDFQIKRKDMVIARYRQHQLLCDQIINKQRNLIDGEFENNPSSTLVHSHY